MDFETYFAKHKEECLPIVAQESLQGFRAKLWGPNLWTLVHLGCAFLEKTTHAKAFVFWLLSSFRYLMFCSYCRESFSVFWTWVVKPHVWTADFSSKLVLLHALVNLKLQKTPLPSHSVTRHVRQWTNLAQLEQTQLLWLRCLLQWLLLVTLNLAPVSKWKSLSRLRQEVALVRTLLQLQEFLDMFPASYSFLHSFAQDWKTRVQPLLKQQIDKDWEKAAAAGRLGVFLFICMIFEHCNPKLFQTLFQSPVHLVSQLEEMRV